MRVAVVLNRRSGSLGDPAALLAALSERAELVGVHEPGDGEGAARRQPDRLIVAGGDGTIGDVFAAAAAHRLPLAVIPGGTANDFARALSLPSERDAAVALATARGAVTVPTWGGRVGGRPFVNVASVGLAVDAAERAAAFKARLGAAAYPVGALRAALSGRSVRASLSVDAVQRADGRVFQLLVGASGRFGGGAGLGESDPGEPQLVAAWVPAGSRLGLPWRAFGLRRRTLEHQPGVAWWRGERVVVAATVDGGLAEWNVDGERWRPQRTPVLLERLGPVAVVTAGT